MDALKIPEEVYLKLLTKAEEEYPLEACGLLAGNGDEISEFFPLTNIEASPEHYSMDPAEQFAAVRALRTHGWELTAIWHSHPATGPRLSEEDRKLAYMPGVSYMVLSLAPGSKGEMRAFRKIDGDFVEQEIKIYR